MMRAVQIVLCSLLLLLFAVAGAYGGVNLVLKERVHVQQPVLHLGEIVRLDVTPDYTGPDLADLEIGPAPLPGREAFVTRSHLLLSLKSRKVPVEEVRFSGAAKTVVLRDAQTVSAQKLRRVVIGYLEKHMPWAPEDVEIGRITGLRDLVLPSGGVTYQVVPQPHADFLGTTPLQVVLETTGGGKKQIWVNADIRAYVPVVTARHPIARLSQIDANDLRIERRNLAGLNSDYFSSVEEVVGTRSRSLIRAGNPIRKNQVEIPPVVRRGDLVTMKVESRLFRITARGKVLENGIPGAIVRVQNIASKKEVYGKVIDGSTVQIEGW